MRTTNMKIRTRILRTSVAAVAATFVSMAAFADVYVSRDINGRLVYSDRKPPGESKQIRIEPRPSPTVRENQPVVTATSVSPQAASSDRAERERQEATQREAEMAERDKQCDAGRRMNAEFGFDGRKCSYHADGTRTCLTSAEIDVKRLEAKRLMAEFCAVRR